MLLRVNRLAEQADRRSRLEKRWMELKEISAQNSAVLTEA